jgi:hypothetical protein
MKKRYQLSVFCLTVLSGVGIGVKSAQGFSLVNSISIPGNSTDLIGGSNPNDNRLGGFFSDLYYERSQNVYYGLVDRGPGGGTIAYDTRVQKFSLDVNPNTGSIGGFKLLDTIKFTNNGQNYNGLNPLLLNGDKSNLGLSFDPEGFIVGSNGNFFVSDEYGPWVNEFKPDGSFVRSLNTPNNLIPKAGTTTNYVDGRQTTSNPGGITSGRQDNRGFEGLTITPDGSTLYAILQDPLVNEGVNGTTSDGRFSRNIRIVKFDVATGNSTGQYIYQLESLADINDRIPGTTNDFGGSAQGRNIGVSSITALNDKEFLVIERDNRGIGEADPNGTNPVGSKRVFKINIDGATDVSNVSLAGTNTLPSGINPVGKSLFLDVAATLNNAGEKIYEKFEGLTIGPKLADGSYAILLGTDNDFSVTQNGSNVQFDVCTNGVTSSQVVIGDNCPSGSSLIPTQLYSIKASSTELAGFKAAQPVPEPATFVGSAVFGMWGLWLKRRMNRKIEI